MGINPNSYYRLYYDKEEGVEPTTMNEISEIIKSLGIFDATGLPWVFMIFLVIAFITYILKTNSFKHATRTMKEMSNDNMHTLAQEIKDEIKTMNSKFASIETLIQNEVMYANRNLVSGLRDEIKIGLDSNRRQIAESLNGGLSKQKFEMEIATKEMVKASRSFRKLCNGCQYKKK